MEELEAAFPLVEFFPFEEFEHFPLAVVEFDDFPLVDTEFVVFTFAVDVIVAAFSLAVDAITAFPLAVEVVVELVAFPLGSWKFTDFPFVDAVVVLFGDLVWLLSSVRDIVLL